jgi:hypothetical protein
VLDVDLSCENLVLGARGGTLPYQYDYPWGPVGYRVNSLLSSISLYQVLRRFPFC